MAVRPGMVHLDATLRLFDPDIQTERALPCAGPSKRSLHFELGEVTRRRWNVMREAEGRAITIDVQIVEQRHFVERNSVPEVTEKSLRHALHCQRAAPFGRRQA